eukprot:c1874_g1_i1.p1 GENE.c1874_g1_i1~~c1874_g1_i1.p1  ORF type:complete len:558 (-),score=120.15 c1874_g1_i1:48-1721(-)
MLPSLFTKAHFVPCRNVPLLVLSRNLRMRGGIDPFTYQGTSFSHDERQRLGIVGLLPRVVEDEEKQLARVRHKFRLCPDSIHKYLMLNHLHETNTRLYYKFLQHNLSETLPVVYTPTVGDACIQYSNLFMRPHGLFLSREDKGHIRKILDNWPRDVEIIVATDGGRILGLGDLGLNGMGIPVGKLALYVVGGGFHPAHTLPVMLDLGTNNHELLNDPLYLGSRHPRLPEDEYLEFLEEFCNAVKDKWPNCLLQFEDFATPHAIKLLEMYQNRMRCFNDDIQGTGSVILAGFINAMKSQGTNPKEVRCVFYGAGSAAIGVAQMIVSLLETLGLTNEEARRRFWMIDSKGLICDGRGDELADYKRPFSRPAQEPMKDLFTVISHVKPHVLMGLAGNGPAFEEPHIREMYKHCHHPIIFPLSNPTSKAEVTAEHAYTWTEGNCIFASGSPFDPVEYHGTTYYPSQGNNMFIFPGVGFGVVACRAKHVTDLMFINAAKALADTVSEAELKVGTIFPSLERLREVSLVVATSTVNTAFEQGLAQIDRPDDITEYCRSRMWDP